MKLDTQDDRRFYEFPRFVTHVDDGFLSQLTQLYRERIPEGTSAPNAHSSETWAVKDVHVKQLEVFQMGCLRQLLGASLRDRLQNVDIRQRSGGAVLDLMSSWVSHLPPEVKYSKVVGHGLNAAELARNKQLSEFFVRDLNKEPGDWALPDKSFDAMVCCVSIQYLQQPERVFQEIYRVLKPGGVCIISFSNRMFYNKAIAAWRDNSDYGRCQLVKQYFTAVEGFTEPELVKKLPTTAQNKDGSSSSSSSSLNLPGMLQSLFKSFALATSDPFFAVVAYRNFKPEHA